MCNRISTQSNWHKNHAVMYSSDYRLVLENHLSIGRTHRTAQVCKHRVINRYEIIYTYTTIIVVKSSVHMAQKFNAIKYA